MAIIAKFLRYTVSKSLDHILIDYATHLIAFRLSSHEVFSTINGAGFNDDEIPIAKLSIKKRSIKKSAIEHKNLRSASKTLSEVKDDEDDDETPWSLKVRRISDVNRKFEYFSSYCIAKKLDEVESPESLVSKNVKVLKSNAALLKVPMGCLYFNDAEFPSEKSLINWIEAVDFGIKNEYLAPLGLSMALSSLCRLYDAKPVNRAKLLSAMGFDRFLSWFQYALEQKNTSSLSYQRSVQKCIFAAILFLKHSALHLTFKRLEVVYLKGYLNYVLSIFVPAKLKSLEDFIQDDRKKFADFFDCIATSILSVEVTFGQLCSLEDETKQNVVEYGIRAFRFHLKLMKESKRFSSMDEFVIIRYAHDIGQLFCRWCVNDLSFWSEWFEFTLDCISKYNTDNPVRASKALQVLLLVLLRANANPNFLRNDANFAQILAEKMKPFFSQYFQTNGLRFVTASESAHLIRHVQDCLRLPESPIFAREELKEIRSFLNNREYER